MRVSYLRNVVRKPYVMCELIVEGKKASGYGVGFSKQAPNDEWNEGAGKELARFRAMSEAMQDYYKDRADTFVFDRFSAESAQGFEQLFEHYLPEDERKDD